MSVPEPVLIPSNNNSSILSPINYHLLKYLIIGNSSVGKTSILNRYIKDIFNYIYDTTVGIDYGIKRINLLDNINVKLQIWDTSGNIKYCDTILKYYNEVDIIFIVYDVTDRDSFIDINKYYNIIKERDSKALIYILANKCDISERLVSTDEGETLADSLNAMYFEVSAKDSRYIYTAFETAAIEIYSFLNNLPFEKKKMSRVRLSSQILGTRPPVFSKIESLFSSHFSISGFLIFLILFIFLPFVLIYQTSSVLLKYFISDYKPVNHIEISEYDMLHFISVYDKPGKNNNGGFTKREIIIRILGTFIGSFLWISYVLNFFQMNNIFNVYNISIDEFNALATVSFDCLIFGFVFMFACCIWNSHVVARTNINFWPDITNLNDFTIVEDNTVTSAFKVYNQFINLNFNSIEWFRFRNIIIALIGIAHISIPLVFSGTYLFNHGVFQCSVVIISSLTVLICFILLTSSLFRILDEYFFNYYGTLSILTDLIVFDETEYDNPNREYSRSYKLKVPRLKTSLSTSLLSNQVEEYLNENFQFSFSNACNVISFIELRSFLIHDNKFKGKKYEMIFTFWILFVLFISILPFFEFVPYNFLHIDFTFLLICLFDLIVWSVVLFRLILISNQFTDLQQFQRLILIENKSRLLNLMGSNNNSKLSSDDKNSLNLTEFAIESVFTHSLVPSIFGIEITNFFFKLLSVWLLISIIVCINLLL